MYSYGRYSTQAWIYCDVLLLLSKLVVPLVLRFQSRNQSNTPIFKLVDIATGAVPRATRRKDPRDNILGHRLESILLAVSLFHMSTFSTASFIVPRW